MASPYQELIALTRRHLTEEYPKESWLWTDSETYEFFRNLTPAKPVAAPPPQRPRAAQAPPPPKKEEPPPRKEEPKPKAQVQPPKRKEQEAQLPDKPADFTEVRTALREVAPHLKIIEEIPDDTLAKRAAEGWKETLPEVVLIAIEANEAQRELLNKIASAVRSLDYSAGCLEDPVDWPALLTAPHLKLILITGQTMKMRDDLMSKYRYDKQRQRHYLDGRLLCPLPELDKLESTPAVKTQLWNTIRHLLQ